MDKYLSAHSQSFQWEMLKSGKEGFEPLSCEFVQKET